MWIDLGIVVAKAAVVTVAVLSLAGVLGWIERKGSALIQDRIGANRAAVLGFAGAGLVNTLLADPIKLLSKEDVVPATVDRWLHRLAPCINLFPALVTFAVIPFGDTVRIAGREIPLRVAALDIGILYVLVMASIGVYGVVLGGWASNNPWSLLGGLRGSAQMISYEIAMGLGLISAILLYGTVDLQSMVRQQAGGPLAWGVVYQPVAFLLLLTAGIAESKRVPFDLPESESELIAGYFTEYSGVKHMMFFMTDFIEIIIVSGLVTTLFFGGWQVPYLGAEGFLFPGGSAVALPHLVVVGLQVAAFMIKVLFFCWFQIVIRWTLPRFRYDQLMRLGWKGLVPLGLANVMVTATALVVLG
jgi:NADH-quinone oxidoreductase subunit H